jgi:hypothetical protein
MTREEMETIMDRACTDAGVALNAAERNQITTAALDAEQRGDTDFTLVLTTALLRIYSRRTGKVVEAHGARLRCDYAERNFGGIVPGRRCIQRCKLDANHDGHHAFSPWVLED